MRVAWFSPLPPAPSGIASYSADVLALLDNGFSPGGGFSIDRFVDSPDGSRGGPAPAGVRGLPSVFSAHDFVWKQQRAPYDLVVYQLGNAPWHDYMWAYLARYPGLVILHDVRLHHARARHLLRQRRFDDYRREFRYSHPDAPEGVAEYAVEGLSGSIYYLFPMLRVVLRTARLVAVHNARVGADLRAQHPGIHVDTIRMGVADGRLQPGAAAAARARLRRDLRIPDGACLFAAFGRVTAEKRIEPILRTLAALTARGRGGHDAHLVLIGDADSFPSLAGLVAQHRLGDRVHVAGHIADDRVADHLAAADVCLCLRWPTAGETSASWLRALAAARPTVVSGLAHLADVPTLDAALWRPSHRSRDPIAISVDLIDEDQGLLAAMSRLAGDEALRSDLARAGHAYWSREHSLELMAEDYRRAMAEAAARPAPVVDDLPSHFTDDYTSLARRISEEMGVNVPGWPFCSHS
jgi:glycosyltransferase involved in cell wall biosynthesis